MFLKVSWLVGIVRNLNSYIRLTVEILKLCTEKNHKCKLKAEDSGCRYNYVVFDIFKLIRISLIFCLGAEKYYIGCHFTIYVVENVHVIEIT